jgi:hypothetical protein
LEEIAAVHVWSVDSEFEGGILTQRAQRARRSREEKRGQKRTIAEVSRDAESAEKKNDSVYQLS